MECSGRSAKSSKQGAIPSRRYRHSHAGQGGRSRACPDRTRKLFGDSDIAHDRLQRAGAGSSSGGFLCSPKAIRSADHVRRHSQASVSLTNPLKTLERVKGIEPSSSAWKAVALPLSYTRMAAYPSRFGGPRSRTLRPVFTLSPRRLASAGQVPGPKARLRPSGHNAAAFARFARKFERACRAEACEAREGWWGR